jgi:hypothetical protein
VPAKVSETPGKGGIGRVLVDDAEAVAGREAGRGRESKHRRRARRREGHRADVRAVLLNVEHGLSRGSDPRVSGRAGKRRREIHGPRQDDLREQRARSAEVRQMEANIERLGELPCLVVDRHLLLVLGSGDLREREIVAHGLVQTFIFSPRVLL